MLKVEYQAYIDKAIEEILKPSLEDTIQYLEVCEIQFENGLPKISRIDDSYKDMVVVYFEVKDERYFIEVRLTNAPEIKVESVWAQSAHRVYFNASSKSLSFEKLSSIIELKPLTGWSIGERKNFKGKPHDHSSVKYEPIKNEAYDLNEKLNLLLDDLETDADGIRKLSEISNCQITVCKHQYVSANAGIQFDISTINRLHRLNLSIDIDTYIVGKEVLGE